MCGQWELALFSKRLLQLTECGSYRPVYIQRHQKCIVLFTYRYTHNVPSCLYTDTNNLPSCLYTDTPTMYRPVYIQRHQECTVLFIYRDTNNVPSCLYTETPGMYRHQECTVLFIYRHQQRTVLFIYRDTNNVPSNTTLTYLFNFKCSYMFRLTLSHPTLCTRI